MVHATTWSKSFFAALVAALALGAAAAADDPAPAAPPAPGSAAPDKPAESKPATEEKKPEGEAKKEEKKSEPARAPDFTLKDLDGKDRKLAEFAGKWVVLEWTNYACPFVKKHYDVGAMQALQKKYVEKGVVWLSICSSAEGKQGHLSADDWKKAVADKKSSPTAVLLDGDGKVGRLYEARTTPEIRIVCPKGTIAYKGAIDDDPSKKGDPAKAKNYVAEALDAALAGKDVPTAETRSYG